jgi:hypothetical protein
VAVAVPTFPTKKEGSNQLTPGDRHPTPIPPPCIFLFPPLSFLPPSHRIASLPSLSSCSRARIRNSSSLQLARSSSSIIKFDPSHEQQSARVGDRAQFVIRGLTEIGQNGQLAY